MLKKLDSNKNITEIIDKIHSNKIPTISNSNSNTIGASLDSMNSIDTKPTSLNVAWRYEKYKQLQNKQYFKNS